LGGKLKQRLFVHWDGQPPSMVTWEDVADMKRRFPTAWGQAVAKAGGNVMTKIRPVKKTRRSSKSGYALHRYVDSFVSWAWPV